MLPASTRLYNRVILLNPSFFNNFTFAGRSSLLLRSRISREAQEELADALWKYPPPPRIPKVCVNSDSAVRIVLDTPNISYESLIFQ